MKVLLRGSETPNGIWVVQNHIDGSLYLLSPCCKDVFTHREKCHLCGKSYQEFAERQEISLVGSAGTRDVSAVPNIEEWLRKALEATYVKVEIEGLS